MYITTSLCDVNRKNHFSAVWLVPAVRSGVEEVVGGEPGPHWGHGTDGAGEAQRISLH